VTDPSPYLPADALPGALGPVPLRCEYEIDGEWYSGIWAEPDVLTELGDLLTLRDSQIRLDLRRPEVRDRVARRVAEVLGVPVGATAPGWRRGGAREWRLTGVAPGGQVTGLARIEDTERRFHPDKPGEWVEKRHPGLYMQIPSLDAIPLHDPDSDALALAAVARWLGDEIRAGRVVPSEPRR